MGFKLVAVLLGVLVGNCHAQTFSDNFSRPDGTVGNGWTLYGAGGRLQGGQLETFGQRVMGGGFSRILSLRFPLIFSFDFSTSAPEDGGWTIAINAVSATGPLQFPAQMVFAHWAGNKEIVRLAGGAVEIGGYGTKTYGSRPAHITGKVQAD